MTVNGSPIGQYGFKPAAATISYKREFEEAQVRVAAGLSLQEYEALPGTPQWIDSEVGGWSKCHYLVWYRMSQLIPAASQDAQVRKMERDAKMNRLRR